MIADGRLGERPRAPGALRGTGLPGVGWTMWRLGRNTALGLVAGPALLVRGLFGPDAGPRILRWFFERCGGGYVKIGQLLASRYDLLPQRYCDELGRLFDDVAPVPTAAIRRIVEQELGAPVRLLFREFDDLPLATASLAQVHSAVLPGGESAVVKVLKPRIEQTLRMDAMLFRLTGRLLDALPVLRGLDVRALFDEMARTALEELDLRREARNTAYLRRRMLADGVAHYVPQVYPSHCAARVLTLERIQGVSVRRMISAIGDGDHEALARWAAAGITPERTAIILFRSVLEQTVRLRTFHADPHPSNLIVMPGGTVAWVDFGLTGWIDERQWELQLRLREAFADGRVHDAYLAMLESVEPIPRNRDLRPFEQEMKRSIRDYLIANEDPNAELTEKSAGVFLMRTLRALRRSRLPVAVSTAGLYRTILIADMVVLRLYPGIQWTGHLQRFIHDVSGEILQEAVKGQVRSVHTAFRLARTPAVAAEALEWTATRLPQLGRSTLRTRSISERMLSTVLRFARGVAVVATLAISIGLIVDPLSLRVALDRASALILDSPPLALVGCVALTAVLHSAIRRVESP